MNIIFLFFFNARPWDAETLILAFRKQGPKSNLINTGGRKT
jgi:hypothetical protein